jgi:transcriptional regulator GlxA family with amidase domain
LAKTGCLDGLSATTNKNAFNTIRATYPLVKWEKQKRWVIDGRYYSSSGVSAGTDLAVFFIGELFGKNMAQRVCQTMEYVPNENPENDPFAFATEPSFSPPALSLGTAAPKKIAVVVYDEFEMLDTFGPLEMFGMANKTFINQGLPPCFEVKFVAEKKTARSFGGPMFQMDCTFAETSHDTFDIVLVPGGIGCVHVLPPYLLLSFRLYLSNLPLLWPAVPCDVLVLL